MNSSTDLDDNGPSLPLLDALGQRASANLRAEVATFDVAGPSSKRPRRRLVFAAAAIVLALIAGGTGVALGHADKDTQRTITGTSQHLFPTFVPPGLRFAGAADPSNGGGADPSAGDEKFASDAVAFASDDDVRALVVYTFVDTGDGMWDQGQAGERLVVNDRRALWSPVAPPVGVLVADLGSGRLGYFAGRDLSRAELERVATSVTLGPSGSPVLAAESVPKDLRLLASDVSWSTFFPSPSTQVAGPAPKRRALGWQGNDGARSRALSLSQMPGSAQSVRLAGLLDIDRRELTVRGNAGSLAKVVLVPGLRQLVWLEGATEVQITFSSKISDTAVLKMANGLKMIDEDEYVRRVADLGGPFGALDPGVMVVAEGSGSRPWRVVVGVADPEQICIDRLDGSSCNVYGQQPDGGTIPLDLPVLDPVELDRSGHPTLVVGSVGGEVKRLTVNGQPADISEQAVESTGRRWFAVALPPGTTEAKVVATDASGRETARRVPDAQSAPSPILPPSRPPR